MFLCCKYHSVGYFVFVRQAEHDAWEPIVEVPDEEEGAETIDWLFTYPTGVRQFIAVANDNTPQGSSAGWRDLHP